MSTLTRPGLFSLTVTPGLKTTHKSEGGDIHLTSAALNITKYLKRRTPTRLSISFSSGTKQTECPLLTLTPRKKEDRTLELTLLDGQEITFSATGNHPVDLIGNTVGGSRKQKFCDEHGSSSSESALSSDSFSDKYEAAEETMKTDVKKARSAGVKPQSWQKVAKGKGSPRGRYSRHRIRKQFSVAMVVVSSLRRQLNV